MRRVSDSMDGGLMTQNTDSDDRIYVSLLFVHICKQSSHTPGCHTSKLE